MTAVMVEDLTKMYGGLAALNGVSFEVPDGQCVAMLGPNGAGKTTTIEILEGFLAPTSGTARVLGADPRRGGRGWRARIGLVMQSTSLDSELSVRDLLTTFAAQYPNPLGLYEALEMVGLEDEAETRFSALSGGQQRRVDVAVGIIGRPDILFLDEPSTGLDPEARRHLWTGIANMTATGMTVLLTTHYMEEAATLADRLIVIADGQLLTDTTPDKLRSRQGQVLIRYPLPPSVPATTLPDQLANGFDADRHQITVRTDDVATVLAELIGWAQPLGLPLDSLEVGPPSLEDAYLALTSQHETTS
jgi:ABC-2 type transport system ATP-binding protein